MSSSRPLPVLLAGACALALGATALAADAARFAEQLADLRGEVELLNEQIASEKETIRGTLRGIELQKTDLEARVRTEELRAEELERAVERQRETLEAEKVAAAELLPVVEQAIDDLAAAIERGLPYRLDERLKALDDLDTQLEEGTLSAPRAASRLWQTFEDELRLSRENAMDRQVIPLDGGEVLVDVARLGMVALYFRTEDGRYGRVTGQPGAWRWELYEGTEQQQQVEVLFEALETQIRVGFFTLPNAIVEG